MPDDSDGMLLGAQSARVEKMVGASVATLRAEIIDDRNVEGGEDRRTIQGVAARTLQTIHVIDDHVDGLRQRLTTRREALSIRTGALNERIEQLGPAPEAPTQYDSAHGPTYGPAAAVVTCGVTVGATIGFARLLGLSWGAGVTCGAIAVALGTGGLLAARGLAIREKGRLVVLALVAVVAALLAVVLLQEDHAGMEKVGGALLTGVATAIIFGIADGVIRSRPRRDFRRREHAWANAVSAAKSELDITLPQETAEIDGLIGDLDELEMNYFGKAREYFTQAVAQIADDDSGDQALIDRKFEEIDRAIGHNLSQNGVA